MPALSCTYRIVTARLYSDRLEGNASGFHICWPPTTESQFAWVVLYPLTPSWVHSTLPNSRTSFDITTSQLASATMPKRISVLPLDVGALHPLYSMFIATLGFEQRSRFIAEHSGFAA